MVRLHKKVLWYCTLYREHCLSMKCFWSIFLILLLWIGSFHPLPRQTSSVRTPFYTICDIFSQYGLSFSMMIYIIQTHARTSIIIKQGINFLSLRLRVTIRVMIRVMIRVKVRFRDGIRVVRLHVWCISSYKTRDHIFSALFSDLAHAHDCKTGRDLYLWSRPSKMQLLSYFKKSNINGLKH